MAARAKTTSTSTSTSTTSTRATPLRLHPAWLLLGAALAACTTACVPLGAHERGALARRTMQLGGTADLTFGEEHAQTYREGSIGGGSVRAGGCGCN